MYAIWWLVSYLWVDVLLLTVTFTITVPLEALETELAKIKFPRIDDVFDIHDDIRGDCDVIRRSLLTTRRQIGCCLANDC